MVFKFFLASISYLSLVCCLLPNARENVRDEQLVRSLSEQSKSLSLGSSPRGLHPFNDELSQIQGVESEKQSEFEALNTERKEAPDEITSLKQDSIELTQLIPDLQRTLEIMRKIQAHKSSKFFQRAIDQFSESITTLIDANKHIDKLKEIKLAELGDVEISKSPQELRANLLSQDSKGPTATAESSQPLRYDPLAKTSTDPVKNYGNGIVKDLKKILTIRQSDKGVWKFLDDHDFLIFQQTAFKMIDFLIKNDFANPERVRQMFQEFDIVANVVKYVELAFYRDLPNGRWITPSFGSHTTEHWYWKYLHDSFRVLGKREEGNVNFNYLLEGLQNQRTIDPPLALFLKQSSLIDRLRARLEMSKATSITPSTVKKYSELLRGAIRKILRMHKKTETNPPIGKKLETSSEDFYHDFSTIMDFLMSYLDEGGPYRMALCPSLVSLLELTDKYLSPGLFKQVMQNHPRSQELENRVELIQHMTKITDLSSIVNSYGALYKNLAKKNSIAVRERENILDKSLHELQDILRECLSILLYENADFRSRSRLYYDDLVQTYTKELKHILEISPPRPFRFN